MDRLSIRKISQPRRAQAQCVSDGGYGAQGYRPRRHDRAEQDAEHQDPPHQRDDENEGGTPFLGQNDLRRNYEEKVDLATAFGWRCGSPARRNSETAMGRWPRAANGTVMPVPSRIASRLTQTTCATPYGADCDTQVSIASTAVTRRSILTRSTASLPVRTQPPKAG